MDNDISKVEYEMIAPEGGNNKRGGRGGKREQKNVEWGNGSGTKLNLNTPIL